MSKSPELHYREALALGRFEIQRCVTCRDYCFPPTVCCPSCGSTDLNWHKASGRGTVHACTVVAQRADKGGSYNVVLVDLVEGVRMMSHVAGFDAAEVPIGTELRAVIEGPPARLVFEEVQDG